MYNIVINNKNNMFTADKCINVVLEYYNTFNSESIVCSYDVIAMKTLPIDKIKTASKEIEELQAIADRFHEDQLAYAELTKKLLEK